jgi:hypothetical protein
VISRAVENPGSMMRANTSESLSLASGDESVCDRLGAHRFAVDTSAIVGYADEDLGPGMARGELNIGSLRLARSQATGGGLDAMVHAVANQMHERIVQLVDHALVQFRLTTVEGQGHVFVQTPPQVEDQAGEAFEGRAQRHGAHAHRVIAQFAHQRLDFLRDCLQIAIFAAGCDLAQPRLQGHQLPDHGDQRIELGCGNADV